MDMPAKMKANKIIVTQPEVEEFELDTFIEYGESNIVGFICPIYDRRILFCTGHPAECLELIIWASKPEIRHKIKLEDHDLTHSCATQVSLSDEDGFSWFIVYIDPETIPKYSNINCVFVHELFHLVYSIMDQAGASLTRESEESFAYLQEYLYGKFISFYPV